eukprot:CAMPEP_0202443544 /NCGR_PEP_ID=MMETSP1360-20130828/2769_1 /ASSEMBLY_ACC=CAM_ASM_000848 /TAXON_ID=515479 /ORGANISM="Licmophora paradoxa, Strain CCMP2313" /LENGTH=96 /DNA_ID=CAMNT_0049059253 /DNA_START=122 /DNA_END=413 /DNA_ORIENTATION=+
MNEFTTATAAMTKMMAGNLSERIKIQNTQFAISMLIGMGQDKEAELLFFDMMKKNDTENKEVSIVARAPKESLMDTNSDDDSKEDDESTMQPVWQR